MSSPNESNPLIKIPQGPLEGILMNSRNGNKHYVFHGIPFAKKPERFELPQKCESWNGVRDAKRSNVNQRCIQRTSLGSAGFIGSEDCLFLNIFTPAFKLPEKDDVKGLPPIEPPNKFPVMVFIHGGGFIGGGDLYGGSYLVDENVVFVTVNYRLGCLGFLNSGDGSVPGNLGLHDQVMALKWIQENIRYFGGDETNVTLMGVSAGAACVHYHMLSNLSTGLFSKAIIQSGSAINHWAFNEEPTEKFKKLLKQLDLNLSSHYETPETVAKLKRMDAEALVAQRKDYHNSKKDFPLIYFAPSIDSGPKHNAFLVDTPMKLLSKLTNEVPLIIGVTGQEGLYFSMPILRDPTQVKQLNEHWSHELPTVLMYEKELISQHEDFAKSIRNFYFDSKMITNRPDARTRLTNMFSDSLFNYSVRKAASIHRSLAKDPTNKIYLYSFEYSGQYSCYNGFEVSETYGAAHADELQYLMNQRAFYSKILKGSKDDRMIDRMVSYWASFAHNGVPSYNGTFPWEPMALKNEVQDDTLRYFRINDQDTMSEDTPDFTKRMDFWDHIPSLRL